MLTGATRLVSSSYFLPGHDVRAMQARVRQHFDAPLKFIQWDTQLASPHPGGGIPVVQRNEKSR
jgi:hypothetical protein